MMQHLLLDIHSIALKLFHSHQAKQYKEKRPDCCIDQPFYHSMLVVLLKVDFFYCVESRHSPLSKKNRQTVERSDHQKFLYAYEHTDHTNRSLKSSTTHTCALCQQAVLLRQDYYASW